MRHQRDFGRHQILNLYPAVVQAAIEHPEYVDAIRHLTALALANKAPRIELVRWYLDLQPDQMVFCPRCEVYVHANHFAMTVCQDCAVAEHYGVTP